MFLSFPLSLSFSTINKAYPQVRIRENVLLQCIFLHNVFHFMLVGRLLPANYMTGVILSSLILRVC